jgi:two-component system nitrate/nitrite sensor histidine kinase NarQ
VNVNQLDDKTDETKVVNIRKTVHQIHEYVRQAINNLRYPLTDHFLPWKDIIQNLVLEFEYNLGTTVQVFGELKEENLSSKEVVELSAAVREALLNIRKHANAENVWIHFKEARGGWICSIEDDGQGFEGNPFLQENHYGLKIMRERCEKMGWVLNLQRKVNRTIVEIRKEGKL